MIRFILFSAVILAVSPAFIIAFVLSMVWDAWSTGWVMGKEFIRWTHSRPSRKTRFL